MILEKILVVIVAEVEEVEVEVRDPFDSSNCNQ